MVSTAIIRALPLVLIKRKSISISFYLPLKIRFFSVGLDAKYECCFYQKMELTAGFELLQYFFMYATKTAVAHDEYMISGQCCVSNQAN